MSYQAVFDICAPLPAGKRAAARILELRELYQAAVAQSVRDCPCLRNPELVIDAMAPAAVGRTTESAWVLPIDCRSRLATSGPVELYRGQTDGCDMSPPGILRATLNANRATGFIVAHNHPSGSLEPSPADIECTTRVIAAGRACQLPCHDHVIITPDGRGLSLRRTRPDLWSRRT